MADADSAENNPNSPSSVITPVACALPNRLPGGPKMSGGDRVRILPGTLLHRIYAREEVEEQYFCNYEVHPDYEARFAAAGLTVAAFGTQGEVRAVELRGHRFFLALLFQPQLSSTPEKPHPAILAYLGAAAKFKEDRSQVDSIAAPRGRPEAAE